MKMKKIGKGELLGIIIETIVGAIMGIMVIANMTIPDVVAWIFGIGCIVTLVSCLNTIRKRNL